MAKIKLAIFLRGQIRQSDIGSQLFKLGLHDILSNVEIKVFSHSWLSESSTMTEHPLPEVRYGREWNQLYHSPDYIYKQMSKFNPSSLSLSNDKDLFRFSREIQYSNTQDTLLQLWIQSQSGWKKGDWNSDWLLNPTKIHAEDGAFQDDRFRWRTIMFQYLLGQSFSASLGWTHYKQWQSKNTEWVPDICLNTRYDAYHNIDPEFVNRLLVLIHTHKKHAQGVGSVFTKEVWVDGMMPAVDDYCFWFLPESGNDFFGVDPWVHFNEIWTENKHKLIMLVESGNALQHTLWCMMGHKCKFTSWARYIGNTTHHETEILRPNFPVEEIMSWDHFDKSRFDYLNYEFRDKYTYPGANTDAPHEHVLRTYNKLNNNDVELWEDDS